MLVLVMYLFLKTFPHHWSTTECTTIMLHKVFKKLKMYFYWRIFKSGVYLKYFMFQVMIFILNWLILYWLSVPRKLLSINRDMVLINQTPIWLWLCYYRYFSTYLLVLDTWKVMVCVCLWCSHKDRNREGSLSMLWDKWVMSKGYFSRCVLLVIQRDLSSLPVKPFNHKTFIWRKRYDEELQQF